MRLFLFINMMQFAQDDITAELILTLTENVSISTPYYLFVFTHVATKEVVSFIKYSGADESAYPQRYNQFTIDPSTVFTGKQPGEWHYRIYEQASDTNTDTTLSGAVIEYGKMILDRATEFEFTKYEAATSFNTYNG